MVSCKQNQMIPRLFIIFCVVFESLVINLINLTANDGLDVLFITSFDNIDKTTHFAMIM